jgi:glutathione S-transferase
MIILYQFPISHYCEKVRWALDHKRLKYQIKNLLPGLHLSKARKLASDTSVPILAHNENVIQGSDNIISYLDETYPERSLTPAADELRGQALEWEQYVDREIGIHVRRCCYHILLDHPKIVISFFAHKGPWYGKLYIKSVFPKLEKTMRKYMNINDESSERSRQKLEVAIERLHNHLQHGPFLVGDQFTRADLAAASLLAPLCRPEKYGLNWPDQLPQRYLNLVEGFRPEINWVDEIYDKYR